MRSSGHSGNTDVTSCRGPEWNQQPYKTGSIRVPLAVWSIDSWSQVDVKVYSSKTVCKIYESSSQCSPFHFSSSVSVSFTRRRRGKKSEKVLRLPGEAKKRCIIACFLFAIVFLAFWGHLPVQGGLLGKSMSGERSFGVDHRRSQRAACNGLDEGDRQCRSIEVGRDQQIRRIPPRDLRSPLPRRMSLKKSVFQGAIHGLEVSLEDDHAAWAGNVNTIAVQSQGGNGDLEGDIRRIAEGGKEQESGVPMPDKRKLPDTHKAELKTGSHTFAGTPMDPMVSVRSVLKQRKKKGKKRSKRKKKCRKDKSSYGSSSSASGSSSNSNTLDSQDSNHPFKEGHRVKQLARKHPGLLTRHALEEMARMLVEQGTANSTSILPLYLKYFRLGALRRDMTPGHRREITTLAHALDRLVQRDILGAMDILNQRVKALELVVTGSAWSVVQHLELAPQDGDRIASHSEMQGAAREHKFESRIQREVSGKGGSQWRWPARDWKGKGGKERKGDGKKGPPKGGKEGQGGQWQRLEPTRPHQ